MNDFYFENCKIGGAKIIKSFFSEDNRGDFIKNYEKNIYRENGILFNDSEDFITISSKYVIRGMHFQLKNPQAKLVSVINGKVYDVIIDLRKESETFGKWEGFYLSSNNKMSLYIPRGCAHGFLSLSDNSVVSYKCDGAYNKETDTGIIWNDPEIAIEWPIPDKALAILGERDRKLMSFEQFRKECVFEYRL